METIKNYIENMFLGYPKTEKIEKIKNDLLSNMEDKYNELKKSGKTENEAIGIVISEFGNIDEILNEVGIKVEENSSEKIFVSENEVNAYLESRIAMGKNISIGVSLCILGVALLVFITQFQGVLYDLLGIILLFVFIAGGVALFIPSGIKLRKYEYLKKDIYLEESLKEQVETKRESFMSTFIMNMVIGVVLCIISVVPLVAISILSHRYSSLGVTILLLIVAIAVNLFVKSGSVYSAYDVLLQRGEYAVKNKKSEKIVGAVASVIWPLTVVAFLIWGFLYGGWYINWILFPIVGILFGAFSALISAIMDDK